MAEEPTANGTTSAEYWRSMEGGLYEELIREREGQINRNYQQQEAFLLDFFEKERARLGRPLSILEFGCGFGRHARYLANLDGVSYSGYDFSEKMLEPLRAHPPASLLPLEEHVFVGPDVGEAVGARKFDVVFTVSVLIHNPPEKVPALIEAMSKLVVEGGAIVLIENQLVPVSVFENTWHDGCWLQSYTEHVKNGFDVEIAQGRIDLHDIYVLRRNGGAPARFHRLGERQPLSDPELAAMAVPKMRQWAKSVEKVMATAGAAQAQGKLYELQEALRAEKRRAAVRKALATVADELASLRARHATELAAIPATPQKAEPAPDPAAPALVWDDPLDTRWAQRDPAFSRVLHVFHQEWHGIRASAGYAPGHKLAITSRRLLTRAEHAAVVSGVDARLIRAVVFHGYSETADELVRLLRKALGTSVSLHAAWLGNTSQFHLEFEYAMFRKLLERRYHGELDGLACVKPDMHLISGHIFEKTLLSLPPRMDAAEPRAGLSGEAFIPVPNDWRKNFYSNLLAGVAVQRLRRIVVTTRFTPFPGVPPERILVAPLPGRAEVFRLMREADIILNATLSECQPMTALEGLALGTPCLTGPIALGDLDRHPYQRLVQVSAVDSIRQVKDAIERVLDMRSQRPAELAEIMADYSRVLRDQALARYREFLSL